jgi:hypothetical protein
VALSLPALWLALARLMSLSPFRKKWILLSDERGCDLLAELD